MRRGIQRCRKCPLHRSRAHAVPGEGPWRGGIFLVGEAPGAREDETGLPFQGPAGDFLDTLLDEAGLTREEVFLTSSVKCRPPGNRTPRRDELATCRRHWLDRQLALAAPRLVVLLGRTPARQVLGETGKLSEVHGRPRALERGGEVLITYHPAAGMRFPRARRAAVHDFRRLAERLSG